uniref:Uncharacterized protein n=1 Tax=Rhizophora mucronata TaxID=61149 RepID=A0A2P2P6X2_RHIMU
MVPNVYILKQKKKEYRNNPSFNPSNSKQYI